MFIEVIEATYVKEYILNIKLNNGREGQVDLEDQLWGPMFEPLKDISNFTKFSVSKTFGTIEWPNGADIAPDFFADKLQEKVY